ncbi:ATP-dependent zinc metalloprotease YME1L isoform X2 [Octopus bimaculoides]|uniref:AAA+ ATPase domain-containing protein n=1 Tax=Octopus bimaculoides TaxID=37653 RepID=A0A0L8FUW3_OCTBM|nr:ATP-dependent zinc metalloprotease YME1L isoform X2 [Octopus bimaculoides]|eukprot:XP_014786919.1 PREDICTED: ATP-dependent zinc metalloprotease YME1 homolog isoform X2 [Octopus bimaculoides]
MFSHNAILPQVTTALSQLATFSSSVRPAVHSFLVSKYYKTLVSKSSSTSKSEDKAAAVLDQQAINKAEPEKPSLKNHGFKDIPADITLADLTPVLGSLATYNCKQGKVNEPLKWLETCISAQTFFENKSGFPENQLNLNNGGPAVLSKQTFNQFIKKELKGLFTYQPIRGFKTHRSVGKTGLGKGSLTASSLDDLRRSVYERLFPESVKSAKKTERFKSIVDDFDSNPEFQEKLKVAFAEGYTARERREPDMKSTLMNRIFRVFFYLFLLWVILQVIQVLGSVGGGIRGFGVLNRDQYEVNPEDITVTFEDVKGVDEAKQELKDIVEYLKNPEKFTALGAKLPKGVLLVGPPGIGKTLLARAVAGEAGVPFFHASGSEFDEIFVGTGAKRVRQLFSAGKMRAPCVIFIDEIDTVGAKRTSSQIHPYANQTINQLLSEMDGFHQNEGVIVLGATNRRDNLDKALLRPGRFDVEVRVFPPDLKGRRDILKYYMCKIKMESDLDVDLLAKGTTGFTGADLENLVNQAALKAAMDGASNVSMEHMEFARDKVLMGPAKKSRIPDEEVNWLTAYHEAGHTIVAYFTSDATPLHKVTIIPRGMSLGHTSYIAEKEIFNKTKAQLLAEIDVCMGGRVAEEVIYGGEKITTGAGSDFQQATAIAEAMVKKFGMSEKIGVRVFDDNDPFDSGLSMLKVNELSPAMQEQLDIEIKRILQESYDRARHIMKTHSTEHKAIAQALMKYETLDSDDVKAIVDGKVPQKLTS